MTLLLVLNRSMAPVRRTLVLQSTSTSSRRSKLSLPWPKVQQQQQQQRQETTSVSISSIAYQVAIGMGAASFWRGAWYILDDGLFPDDPATSAAASWGLGIVGVSILPWLVERQQQLYGSSTHSTMMTRLRQHGSRIGVIYVAALSCVLIWRGTWLGWDVAYEYYHNHVETNKNNSSSTTMYPHNHHHVSAAAATDPGHASRSGVWSHGVAIVGLLAVGSLASVLAPPAATCLLQDSAATLSKLATKKTLPTTTRAPKVVQLWWHKDNPDQAHVIYQRQQSQKFSSSSSSSSFGATRRR